MGRAVPSRGLPAHGGLHTGVNLAVEKTLAWKALRTIRIRLGHEWFVTLAYLKGKDAESEEAREHANSSSLALYA
jgi:hypothetical protein